MLLWLSLSPPPFYLALLAVDGFQLMLFLGTLPCCALPLPQHSSFGEDGACACAKGISVPLCLELPQPFLACLQTCLTIGAVRMLLMLLCGYTEDNSCCPLTMEGHG